MMEKSRFESDISTLRKRNSDLNILRTSFLRGEKYSWSAQSGRLEYHSERWEDYSEGGQYYSEGQQSRRSSNATGSDDIWLF
jgi:hypothetical protein